MSYVYQSKLKPVNSLELPSFSILVELSDKTLPYKFDAGTLYSAYWRRLTIRNFMANAAIYYRTEPGANFDAVPPNSEREASGWASYIEIRSDNSTINGVLDIEMVRWGDAFN